MQVGAGPTGGGGDIKGLFDKLTQEETHVQNLIRGKDTKLTHIRSRTGEASRHGLQKSIETINKLITALPTATGKGSEEELTQLLDHLAIINGLGEEISTVRKEIDDASNSCWHAVLTCLGFGLPEGPTRLETKFATNTEELRKELRDRRAILLIDEAVGREGVRGVSWVQNNKVTLQCEKDGHRFTSDIIVTDAGYKIGDKVFQSVNQVLKHLDLIIGQIKFTTPPKPQKPIPPPPPTPTVTPTTPTVTPTTPTVTPTVPTEVPISGEKRIPKPKPFDMDIFLEACKGGPDKVAALIQNMGWNPGAIVDKERGANLLHIACAAGASENVVAWLLQQNIDVNIPDKNDLTPLHLASSNGHAEVVKQLLTAKNIDVNKEDKNKSTPLHLASGLGHSKAVEQLLTAKDIDVNKEGKDKWTPLHLASAHGHANVIKQLLTANNIDVNKEGENKWTPLHLACEKGQEVAVQLLIEKNADCNKATEQNITPLHLACQYGRTDIVKQLLDAKAMLQSKDMRGDTPLDLATRNNHQKCIDLLNQAITTQSLEKKLLPEGLYDKFRGLCGQEDVSSAMALITDTSYLNAIDKKSGETLLHGVMPIPRSGDIVLQLIQKGADLEATDRKGNTPLHLAALQGNKAATELLIKNHANVEARAKDGRTPLHVASATGHAEVVQILTDNGANPLAVTKDGKTPLHMAAFSNRTEAVEALTNTSEGKKALHATDEGGKTPLHLASGQNYPAMIDLLVHSGAEINATDSAKETALHHATRAGHLDNVLKLIENRANVNAQNEKGQSPLHLAYIQEKKKLIDLLLEKGADPNLQDKYGNTPAPVGLDIESLFTVEEPAAKPVPAAPSVTQPHPPSVGKMPPTKVPQPSIPADIVKNFEKICENDALDQAKTLIREEYLNARDENGETLLHIASELGAGKVVKWLLEQRANVNAQDENKKTPLHLACSHGNVDMVKQLLAAKDIDPSQKDASGWTAIHVACSTGNLEVVRLLVEKGVSVTETTKNNHTPLHFACNKGHIEVAKLLIKAGASVDQAEKDGCTPLHFACNKGHIEVAKLLIDNKANLNLTMTDGSTPLHLTCEADYAEIARLLIDGGANRELQNKAGLTPLQVAEKSPRGASCATLLKSSMQPPPSVAEPVPIEVPPSPPEQKSVIPEKVYQEFVKICLYNDLKGVEKLINDGYINAVDEKEGKTLLHIAAAYGKVDIANQLIAKGAQVTATDKEKLTPLHWAAIHNQKEIAELLISHGANLEAVDKYNRTPLHRASHAGHAEVVQLFVDKKANLMAQDNDRSTPLHLAVSCAEPEGIEAAKVLIEKGGKKCLEAQDELGDTPLHAASWENKSKMVELFLDNDANVDATNKEGMTPLHTAASQGNLESAKLLRLKDADINAQDSSGFTPLHRACSGGAEITKSARIELIKWLLSVEADKNIKDNKKLTPAQLAEDEPEILALFKKGK